MTEPILIQLGNVHSKVTGPITPKIFQEIDRRTSFTVPGYWFSKLYKTGKWDGRKHLLWRASGLFPTGLAGYVCDGLQHLGCLYKVVDLRKKPKVANNPLKLKGVEKRDYQIEAIETGVRVGRGIFDLSCGGGKTELAAGIIQVLGLPSLVVTHRKELLYQTGIRLQKRFGPVASSGIGVGYIGDGNWDLDTVTVAMIETLASCDKEELKEFLNKFDVLFIDEGHLLAAKVFYSIIQQCQAYFRFLLCVAGRTRILMSDGRELAIAYLHRWHTKWEENTISVKTFNFENGMIEDKLARVVRVPVKRKESVRCLNLTFRCEDVFRTLRCSPEHKIFSVSKQEFIGANELKVGDEIKLTFRTCKNCGKVLSPGHLVRTYCSYRCSGIVTAKMKRSPFLQRESNPVEYYRACEKQRECMLEHYKTPQGVDHARASSKMMRSGRAQEMADKVRRLNLRWGSVTDEEKREQLAPMIEGGKPFRSHSLRGRGYIRVSTKDGHICHSSYEAIVDDWLFEHGLSHKVHPRIPNSNSWSDFLVGDTYIEVDGMHRGSDYKRSVYFEKSLKVIYIVFTGNRMFRKKVNYQLTKLLDTTLHDPVGILVKKERVYDSYTPKYLYDLQVEGNNNYFANGILVHNSGTPLMRDDNRNLMIIGATGPVIYKVGYEQLIREKVLAEPRVEFSKVETEGLEALENEKLTNKERIALRTELVNLKKKPLSERKDSTKDKIDKIKKALRTPYAKVYEKGISKNKKRNFLIMEKVKEHKGEQVLILIRTIDHGKVLQKLFKDNGIKSEFIWGDDDPKHRSSSLSEFKTKSLKVLISSMILKEGVDVPRIEVLIVASGNKSKITTLQSLGRALRVAKGKTKVLIIDFMDCGHRYLLTHSKRRLSTYEKEGFKVSVE